MLKDTMPPRSDQPTTGIDNPYQVLAGEMQTSTPTTRLVPREELITIAIVWLAGTAVAGAAFGTLLFPIIGTVFGFVMAIITGLPVSLVVFSLTRMLPGPVRQRSTVLCMGALSGGLSGFLAVSFFLGFRSDLSNFTLVAIGFGAVGNAVATRLYLGSGADFEKTRYTPPVWSDLEKVEPPSGEFRF